MATALTVSETNSINAATSFYSNIGSKAIAKYVRSVSTMSKSTAYEYYTRLTNFDAFVSKGYRIKTDDLLQNLQAGSEDPYDVLSNYSTYLQSNCVISPTTLKQRVVTAKNFLEYHDVDLSPRKFKLKVKLPRSIRKNREALVKVDVINILNACSDIRLKTYVMFLAATGCRASEAASIRINDLDLASTPAKVLIRGECTKTKVERSVFLTAELAAQLKNWLEYKYRKRRICHKDQQKNYTITNYYTPERKDSDLIFSVRGNSSEKVPSLQSLYNIFRHSFAKTLDRIDRGTREDITNRRRKITLHSFRRFVKSTISDLGYSDFSEFFIGHTGSTYYRKSFNETSELFKKIEAYLTFLDYTELEARGADVVTKLDEKDKQIEALTRKQQQFEQLIQSLVDSGQLKAVTVTSSI
jgi:integrase